MGHRLCSELVGWWAWGMGGSWFLGGGPELKTRGARAKISRGPKPFFFFLGKFYLLIFFFGPRGGSGPLSLLPGSVPASNHHNHTKKPKPKSLDRWPKLSHLCHHRVKKKKKQQLREETRVKKKERKKGKEKRKERRN